MKFTPSIASLSDLDTLVRLENICFDSDRISRRQYRYLLHSKSALITLIKVNQEAIAAAVYLFRKNSKRARIYSFSVDTSYRNLGISTLLSLFGEEECKKRSSLELCLEVKSDNARAISFYLKNQFQIFGNYPAYYSDGQDAIRMIKKL